MLKEINAQIQEKNKRIRRVEFEDEEEEDKDEEIIEPKPKEAKPAVSQKDITERYYIQYVSSESKIVSRLTF